MYMGKLVFMGCPSPACVRYPRGPRGYGWVPLPAQVPAPGGDRLRRSPCWLSACILLTGPAPCGVSLGKQAARTRHPALSAKALFCVPTLLTSTAIPCASKAFPVFTALTTFVRQSVAALMPSHVGKFRSSPFRNPRCAKSEALKNCRAVFDYFPAHTPAACARRHRQLFSAGNPSFQGSCFMARHACGASSPPLLPAAPARALCFGVSAPCPVKTVLQKRKTLSSKI